MNGRLVKAIRGATRKAGRPTVEYAIDPAPMWAGPGTRQLMHGQVRLTKNCDRYHAKRLKPRHRRWPRT